MAKVIVKRLLSAVAVLFVVTLITFCVLRIIPGDPAMLILGTDATPEKLAELRHAMGMDLPVITQYFNWIKGILCGDWGTSYLLGGNVLTLIMQRLPITVFLTIYSMLIAVSVSAVLGTLSALRQGGSVDIISRSLMQLGSSIPSFWLSMIFMILFTARLKWFPVSGYVPPSEGMGAFIKSLTLPACVMAIGEMGILIRMFRTSMLKSLNEDFMIATQVKGLSKFMAITKYALRSAVIAPITIIGNQMAKLFGGTVIVETIFSLGGIGRLLLTSVEQRDTILLQGIVLFITFMVVLINFLTDILVMVANPLIRLNEGEGGV